MTATTDQLAAAYQRLHAYGPEYGGDEEGNHGMTNHGPMAVEVVLRRGLDVNVDHWLDRYVRRLAEIPPEAEPISSHRWRPALGDARRLPDWTAFFRAELRERPWSDVVTQWWPRLLPGIVAGSTHGVIRVGHAVRALRGSICDPPPRELRDELAHGLAFWAARHRVLPHLAQPSGWLDPPAALRGVARLEKQDGLVAHRVARLAVTPRWGASLRALRPAASVDGIPERLASLVDSAVEMYLLAGRAAPVLMVHAATAPNAVRHVLPSLPVGLWEPSFAAAWAATAAVVAMYAPPEADLAVGVTPRGPAPTASDALERAARHGDEHVLKFADTAVEAYDRTQDPDLLAATLRAGELIPAP